MPSGSGGNLNPYRKLEPKLSDRRGCRTYKEDAFPL